MAVTDLIVLIFLSYHGFAGWHKGFWRCVLGPAAFFISLVVAGLYFQKTQNIFVSFAISFLGPFIFKAIGSGLIFLSRLGSGEATGEPFFIRTLGLVFNLLWGAGIAALFVVTLGILPTDLLGLPQLKVDVVQSRSFTFLSERLAAKFPVFMNKDSAMDMAEPMAEFRLVSSLMAEPSIQELMEDPEAIRLLKEGKLEELKKMKKFRSIFSNHQLRNRIERLAGKDPEVLVQMSQEYLALIQDPRIKELITDADLLNALNERNYLKLFGSQKVAQVFSDPELLKNIFEFQRQMVLQGVASTNERAISKENL